MQHLPQCLQGTLTTKASHFQITLYPFKADTQYPPVLLFTPYYISAILLPNHFANIVQHIDTITTWSKLVSARSGGNKKHKAFTFIPSTTFSLFNLEMSFLFVRNSLSLKTFFYYF
jgi:hypothetical protein